MNNEEMQAMINCARKNKRFFVEAVWTRFFPAVKQVRKWIDEGIIGDVVGYDGSFGINMPSPKDAPRIWVNNQGGGATLDLGIYTLHMLPMLFGVKIPKIKAIGSLGSLPPFFWPLRPPFFSTKRNGKTQRVTWIVLPQPYSHMDQSNMDWFMWICGPIPTMNGIS